MLRKHEIGRDTVELLLAHSEKNASVAVCGHVELGADRTRTLENLVDRVEALTACANAVPLRAAGLSA